MHRCVASRFASLLLGCAAEGPTELELGGPAVSEDGRYVLHDRKDEFWESDGGESWRDYHDHEPLEEGSLALVDL